MPGDREKAPPSRGLGSLLPPRTPGTPCLAPMRGRVGGRTGEQAADGLGPYQTLPSVRLGLSAMKSPNRKRTAGGAGRERQPGPSPSFFPDPKSSSSGRGQSLGEREHDPTRSPGLGGGSQMATGSLPVPHLLREGVAVPATAVCSGIESGLPPPPLPPGLKSRNASAKVGRPWSRVQLDRVLELWAGVTPAPQDPLLSDTWQLVLGTLRPRLNPVSSSLARIPNAQAAPHLL